MARLARCRDMGGVEISGVPRYVRCRDKSGVEIRGVSR